MTGSMPCCAAGGQDRREAVLPACSSPRWRASSHTWSAPVARIRRMIALATTSRGARSASACTPCHEPACRRRRPGRAPSPRTASEISGCWPLASGAEPEHGRVELDELQVGDHRAGPQRERDAVAGGDRRVGGGGEDLAHAAGGQHHGAGACTAPTPSRCPRPCTCRVTPAARPSSSVSRSSTSACSITSIAAVAGRRRDAAPADLGAGGVAAGVHDAVARGGRPPG